MPGDKRKDRAQKKRQQQARKALEAFLAKLRDACKTIAGIEQWLAHTKLLESILHEYEDALPSDAQTRLRAAMKVADATRAALEKACEVLQLEVEKVIALLPAAAALSLGTALIAALIVGAVAVGGAAAISAATAATLTIENKNCGDIIFPPIPIPAPGLELPNRAIRAGEYGDAKIPFWVTMNVDATVSPLVLRTLAGSFTVPGNVTSIKLADSGNPAGTELLIPGRSTPVNLGGKTDPRLVILCG